MLQVRANLNGGELDERLPSNHIKKEKRWCTPSNRPKWRRARCSVLRNGEEDVEDRPRTSLNGGELVRSTFVVLPLPVPLPLWPPLSLSLFLPFFPPLGAKSLPFCFATVKKEYLEPVLNHSLWGLWLGLYPCPWRFVEESYLSSV